jgi:hypothetical protein
MLDVKILRFKDIPEELRNEAPNNGGGKEWANYLTIWHDGNFVSYVSDAMEPEDAKFTRDLSEVKDMIRKAYEFGLADAAQTILDQKNIGFRLQE